MPDDIEVSSEYLAGSTQTTQAPNASEIAPEVETTATATAPAVAKVTESVQIEAARYGIGKPIRVVRRGRIIASDKH